MKKGAKHNFQLDFMTTNSFSAKKHKLPIEDLNQLKIGAIRAHM